MRNANWLMRMLVSKFSREKMHLCHIEQKISNLF